MDKGVLGQRLRALRQARGLSLADVAQATDLSSSFLSLVEQGKSDITIGRLARVARFHGFELSELVGENGAEQQGPLVVRRPPMATVHSPSEGIDLFLLVGGGGHRLNAVLAVYQPGGRVVVDAGSAREALAHVIAGVFELTLEGSPPVALGRGDSVLYATDRCHEFRNAGGEPGELLVVTAGL